MGNVDVELMWKQLKDSYVALFNAHAKQVEEAEADRDRWRNRALTLARMLHHVYNGGQLDRAATITAIAACDELKGNE